MSTLRVDSIQNRTGGDLITAKGMAAAWVNFNGTSTVAIRSQHNVSSITDNGTGNYTINFATAMASANYAAVGATAFNNSTFTKGVVSPTALNTGSAQVLTSGQVSGYVTSSDNADHPIISVAFFQ